MKRRDLIRELGRLAAERDTAFELVREGAAHSIYRFGSRRIPIPRHTEIGERLARAIIRQATD